MEPAFDCSNFQYQVQPGIKSGQAALPFDRHIFQSHFLDAKLEHLWTADKIDEKHCHRAEVAASVISPLAALC